MKGAALVATAICLVISSSLSAQTASEASTGIAPSRSPAVVTIASAILPGSGQILMHQKRSAVYLALEAAGLSYYVSQNREGNRDRRQYRSLSRNIARAQLSPTGPDGTWDYYEHMEKYVASGSYDRVAGGDVDPETDPETFNGAMWLLARQTYWRDPDVAPASQSDEYRSAISFYLARAVTPEFLWSWMNDPAGFQKYRSAIAGSNNAFRNAEQTLSLILANHFLSAIDAYASVKMQVRRNGQGITTLSASLAF
jgi:hypothetical protein